MTSLDNSKLMNKVQVHNLLMLSYVRKDELNFVESLKKSGAAGI